MTRSLLRKDRILPREDDKHPVLVMEGKTSSSFSAAMRGELYGSGSGLRVRKHARGVVTLPDLSDQHGGSIGEHFTVPPNSSDVDALRARFWAETSIVVRHWVQAGGGIEVDGSDQGDGDKDDAEFAIRDGRTRTWAYVRTGLEKTQERMVTGRREIKFQYVRYSRR
ncbi:hypothetical protein ARMGADRAFT_1039151 [Armillaria gallica]|uniref:Uncharacterized protein n=1 Tax=Armillaria gallica TaxID=47427 RepID=A0A2H3CKB3_ARMGA|nr:hypothetical protein ARMGADRAFT_1039151 [Armillaria gallica]